MIDLPGVAVAVAVAGQQLSVIIQKCGSALCGTTFNVCLFLIR